jgi:hypothetical protein
VLAIPVLSMPIAIGSSLGGAVCPRNAENRPNRPVGIRLRRSLHGGLRCQESGAWHRSLALFRVFRLRLSTFAGSPGLCVVAQRKLNYPGP